LIYWFFEVFINESFNVRIVSYDFKTLNNFKQLQNNV